MADSPPTWTYTAPDTTSTPPPLTGSANISIREYIYFLPHPLPAGTPIPYTPGLPTTNPLNLPAHPFEPTHTLVLTSPGQSFVDLRYLKPQHAHDTPLPNRGEPARLEWGFAGRSSSTVSAASPHAAYGVVGHSTWTHWVDSRCQVGETAPRDEGDMYAVSAERTVEHGVAFHPQLGRVAGHEEAWRDVDVDVDVCSTERDSSLGVQNPNPHPSNTIPRPKKSSILLRCHDDALPVRGVVLRVGQYCQGIVIVGDVVTTERWEYSNCSRTIAADELNPQEEDNCALSWKRTARTGPLFLPCAATFQPASLRLGGRVRHGALEWLVEELWEWV